MTKITCNVTSRNFLNGQSGAVLYVAMIILILLALLGIVGMRVTGLQERMSSNYRAANLAFQGAEQLLRTVECTAENSLNETGGEGCSISLSIESCDEIFDVGDWVEEIANQSQGKESFQIRSIAECIPGYTSSAQGKTVDASGDIPVYQISVYQVDDASNPTADAAIDTIFRP